MVKYYLMKEEDNEFFFNNTFTTEDAEKFKFIFNEVKVKILRLLSANGMYATEIAQKLGINEQNVYYHLKQMVNAGIIEVCEKKEIRGTIAKKYRPVSMNFCLNLNKKWNKFEQAIIEKEESIEKFFAPIISEGRFNAHFIIGSPDPHGPFKARCRDGHYSIDLALFLGRFSIFPKEFSVILDVDTKSSKALDNNLIVVGGPITNLITAEINKELLVKFNEKKPWGLISKNEKYTDESIGVIEKIPNPYFKGKYVIFLAGITHTGTKSAVIALTRHYKELLKGYKDQEKFARVVQGFDMDGDGKIDTIEILE